MGLTIELNPHKGYYSAGDTVKGNVVLSCDQDEPIGRVSITFYGRAKTKIRKNNDSRSTTRGRSTMFWYSQDLYTGKYTFRRGRHEWPFEFRFPLESKPNPENDDFDNSNPWTDPRASHSLPPNFCAYGYGVFQNTECFVEYKLDASLTRPSDAPLLKSFSTKSSTRELKFLPRRPQASPPLLLRPIRHSFTAKSLLLLPERANDTLTIREKLRSTFKKSDLPSANFTVELTYPAQVYPGGPIPVTLALKGIKASDLSRELENPTVYVKEAVIRIKASIQCRTRGFLCEHYGDISKYTDLVDTSGRIFNVELPRPSKAIEAGMQSDEIDLTDLEKGKHSRNELISGFQTINISVEHTLQIKFKLMCADKEFKIQVDRPLKVLPAAYRDNITAFAPVIAESSSSQARRNVMTTNRIAEQSELPAYEAPPRYELTDHNVPELEASSSRAELEGDGKKSTPTQ